MKHSWPSAVLSLFVLAAIAACASDGATTGEPAEPPAALVPIGSEPNTGDGLVKWVRPIRVSVVGADKERHIAAVENRVSWIRGITRHSVRFNEDIGGNVVLIFEKNLPETALTKHAEVLAPLYTDAAAMAADLRDDGEDQLCIAKRAAGEASPFELAYAVGLVPSELSREEVAACVHRLLVSTMSSSIRKGRPLVRTANPEEETDREKLVGAISVLSEVVLLKVAYDRRAKPGMTAKELEPVTLEITKKVLP